MAEDMFAERIALFQRLGGDRFQESIARVKELILSALMSGNKIMIFGNGGSAAQSQHFAAELVCRFQKTRRALPAIALTTDSSILTAQSNDFGFEFVFARQIDALCQPGDVVIGLTTSDIKIGSLHSINIIKGFISARNKSARCVGFFSSKTRRLLDLVNLAIMVPSENTALVQEAHLVIIHILCQKIEEEL